ncbi:uncharacterized protein LOC144441998 [Glandiceps talaboti]
MGDVYAWNINSLDLVGDARLVYTEIYGVNCTDVCFLEKELNTTDFLSQLATLLQNVSSSAVASEQQLSDAFDNLSNITENLQMFGIEFGDNEEITEIAQALVAAVDTLVDIISFTMESSFDKETLSPETIMTLTHKTMDILEKTADFVLNNINHGNITVVVDTSRVMLHMESGFIGNGGNKTIDLGHNSGFEIPSIQTLFPMVESDIATYIKAYRITGNPFSRSEEYIYNVLGLEVGISSGTRNKVTDTKEDFGVWLGRQSPRSFHGESVMVAIADDWKNYTWSGQVSEPFAALRLTVVSSTIIVDNTTVKVYYETPNGNASELIYSTTVMINGTQFDIFVAEHDIWYNGNYTFCFDLSAGKRRVIW